MVDRIVPATTDADRERISLRLGLHDAWLVVAEQSLALREQGALATLEAIA